MATLREQVHQKRFNNRVRAARQRRFVAGCAANGSVYSRAQHVLPRRKLSPLAIIGGVAIAIVIGLAAAWLASFL
jgi:hypothetical protein